jgi:hypothetical protein
LLQAKEYEASHRGPGSYQKGFEANNKAELPNNQNTSAFGYN